MDGFVAPFLCCAGAFVMSLAPVIAWNRKDITVIVVWFASFIAIIIFIVVLWPLMSLLTEVLNDEKDGVLSFVIVLLTSTALVTAITGTLGKVFK